MRWPNGYVVVVGSVVTATLTLFAVVELVDVGLLSDPVPAMRAAGALAGVLGVGLLLVDVALPVPSSLVMTAHGAVYGAAVGGALSFVGGAGATLVGFVLGRRGRPTVERVTTPDQRERAERWLARWGALAVVVTRPVPVAAETVAVIAGTSRMRWWVAGVAGAAGSLPAACLYGLAGAAVT